MQKNPQGKSLKYRTFELAYKDFALPLMKFLVKRMGGNQEAAEEVFSQTALAALASYDKFQYKSSFFTWVCRIGLNKIADYYKHQINERSKLIAPGLEALANIGSKDLSPEERLSLEELRKSVIECLLVLPEDKRKLLYLRYWKEMSLKAIAESLNTSERSIEGKLYRARLDLREIVLSRHPDLAYNFLVD